MSPEGPAARGGRSLPTLCAGLLLCTGSVIPEVARAKDSLTVDLSAGLQASTNPDLGTSSNGAIGGQVGAAANYRIVESRTTVNLSAATNASTYFDGRKSDWSAGGSANLQHRASQTVSIGLEGHYNYTRTNGGVYPLYNTGLGATPAGSTPAETTPTAPIIPPPVGVPLPPDVTLVGRALTERSFGGSINLQVRTSARSTLSLSGDANRVTYNDPLLSNYRSFGQAVSFSRLISEATTVTAQTRVTETRYDNGEHDTIITPMIGVTRKLSRVLDLSVYGGASIVRSRLPDGTRLHSSTLALSGNICGTYERSKLCINASRQETPTAFGGVRPVTSLGVSYFDRLNTNDTLSLSGQIDRSGRDTRRLFAAQTSAQGTARYDHRLSDRLSLFGSAQYVRLWQSGTPARSDLRGVVGIALRLGDKA